MGYCLKNYTDWYIISVEELKKTLSNCRKSLETECSVRKRNQRSDSLKLLTFEQVESALQLCRMAEQDPSIPMCSAAATGLAVIQDIKEHVAEECCEEVLRSPISDALDALVRYLRPNGNPVMAGDTAYFVSYGNIGNVSEMYADAVNGNLPLSCMEELRLILDDCGEKDKALRVLISGERDTQKEQPCGCMNTGAIKLAVLKEGNSHTVLYGVHTLFVSHEGGIIRVSLLLDGAGRTDSKVDTLTREISCDEFFAMYPEEIYGMLDGMISITKEL